MTTSSPGGDRTGTLAPRAALLRFPLAGTPRWLAFEEPVETVLADHIGDVIPAMEAVDAARRAGLWAVGMVSYDAGPAFDPAIVSLRHHDVPLVAFGLYRAPTRVETIPDSGPFAVSGWSPSRSPARHRAAVRRVKEAIARGDTYQVNYTVRLRSRFTGDPRGLFAALCRAQPSDHLAYLDLDRAAVCSASPELFFERHGDRILTRPMKGTRPRHRDESEDLALIEDLRTSEKDRAENTMIVDMARNDLGRIADVGSVEVDGLHTVETYPTVHQLTSTVTARSGAGLAELFTALFPAASITGAPKVSTSSIIADLEGEPRGIYTGTVGAVAPDGTMSFNVAIRTAWIDRSARTAEYGVGGGIVWDSEPAAERQEAMDKARILSRAKPDLQLLETMRWDPDTGVDLADRHVLRLERSAAHFGYRLDPIDVKERLTALDRRLERSHPWRIRLLVDSDGGVETTWTPLGARPTSSYRAVLDDRPVDRRDEFIYHKTTERSRYDRARRRAAAAFPGRPIDDVILWNDRGEVCETTIGNLVVTVGGRRLTPPVDAGLLPGTMRAELIDRGEIEVAPVAIADLERADAIHMINSVRGWTELTLVSR